MTFLKRTAAVILGGAILCSATALALDAKPDSKPAVTTEQGSEQQPPILAERELYYGKIKEIIRDEKTNAVTGLYMESEAKGEYVFHIDEATLMFNSGEGIRANVDQLEVGQGVYIYHSPVATMSLPPQSYAEAIVTNIPADAGCAQLYTVEQVKQNEDGTTTVLTDRGRLELTIAKDAAYSSYLGTRQILTADNLKVGTRFFTWHSAVQESAPAKAQINRLVLAPVKEQQTLFVTVDGKQVEGATAKTVNDTLMVSASAAAKALGFEVKYEKTAEGEQVSLLKNDAKVMTMDIGSDTYHMGEQTLGYGAPAVIEEGVTFMPAQALADAAGVQLSLTSNGSVGFQAKCSVGFQVK